MAGSDTVQSVERALDMLQALAGSDGGMRLGDLAKQLDLNTSTAHNLVRTLIGRGFVLKGQGQRLRMGPALGELVAQEADHQLLRAAAARGISIQRIFPTCIINLAEPIGGELRVRIRLSGDRPGQVQRPASQAAHLYGSAVGLCSQAFADQGTVQALRETQPFHEHGASMWASPELLAEHLRRAHGVGLVETPFATQELWRIAAPVFGTDGHFVAAFGVALPIDDATPEARRDLTAAVRAAATAIPTSTPEQL
jgi:DNA-binding IclR family transcriptional regulator